jgi:murein L,D-transpeptidase YcbB/YkuD
MDMATLADPAWGGGGVFDANFEAWLMAFQRRNGLAADGIVGPNTLIHLMAPTISEPRLVTEARENS